jgi:predicted amidohydrolase YtcJ
MSSDPQTDSFKLDENIAIADLAGWGDQIGSISLGKYADFVILDQTLLKPVGQELKSARVSKTFFAGQLIFQKN